MQKSCTQECKDEPEDLSTRRRSRLKRVPPPLDLQTPKSLPKEALPFRKRPLDAWSDVDPKSPRSAGAAASPAFSLPVSGPSSPLWLPWSALPTSPSPLSPSPLSPLLSPNSLLSPLLASPLLGASLGLGALHTLLPGSRVRVLPSTHWLMPAAIGFRALIVQQITVIDSESPSSTSSIVLNTANLLKPGLRLRLLVADAVLEVEAECPLAQFFFVAQKGWASARPGATSSSFGLNCAQLEVSDVLWAAPSASPTSAPATTPELCEQMTRFDFRSPRDKSTVRSKRPMNGFMLFAQRHRLDLIQRHPGKDNRAISVLLGETWKNLHADVRNHFSNQAKILAEEHKKIFPDCWKRKRNPNATNNSSNGPNKNPATNALRRNNGQGFTKNTFSNDYGSLDGKRSAAIPCIESGYKGFNSDANNEEGSNKGERSDSSLF